MLIPEGFAQVNWIFGGSAAPTGAEVTLGISINTWVDPLQDLAQALHGFWEDSVLPLQCSEIALQSTRVKAGPNDTGQMVEYSEPLGGGSSAEAVSPQVSVLVSKQTVVGGRRGRGRMFVPGTPETDIGSNGTLSVGAIGFLQAAFDELHQALDTNNTAAFLLHTETPSQPAPYFIESFAVQVRVATQRKRMRR